MPLSAENEGEQNGTAGQRPAWGDVSPRPGGRAVPLLADGQSSPIGIVTGVDRRKWMNSENTLQASALHPRRGQAGPASEKEQAARAALEERAGCPLSDLEWDRARARLLEFVSILRAWQRKETRGSELVKVA